MNYYSQNPPFTGGVASYSGAGSSENQLPELSSGTMTTSPDETPKGQHLQALDDLLHCGICFDYFNIAMIIPQCSHNYCSLCIRRFLSYKTQCPTCLVTVTEPDLRNNRLLDDVVQTFLTARKHMSHHVADSLALSSHNLSTGKLAAARSQGCSGKKTKEEGTSMVKFLTKTNKEPTSEISLEETIDFSLSAHQIKQEESVDEESVAETSFTQGPSTSASKVTVKVECPVCGVGILEQYINKHLDSCLTRDEKKESLRSSGQKRKPITKVVYNLMSEKDLRKKLKEVGLSTQGSKQQMIRRHQEFVHMYNSQSDSLNPKSAAEIIQEIEKNEKIRSSLEAKQESAMTFKKEQSEEEIDSIHQQYRKKHKSEFQQLVEQVKGRWRTGKDKKVKGKTVDGETDTDEQDKEDTGPCREPGTVSNLLHESMEESFLRVGNTSIVRSSSPVFPLSPESTVSSSSDILRDIEEATVLEKSSSAL
ncbi:LOW QUALITY PROTEIN: E3 ubiquitin-protein ligase RAD18 [Gastrophryne carolinensis]